MRVIGIIVAALVMMSAIGRPQVHQFVPQATRPVPAVNVP
jgi:hypothetical protein